MRHRLDFWVLHSLFASHFSGSAVTAAQQNAQAVRDYRGTLFTLLRRGSTLGTTSYRVIPETFASLAASHLIISRRRANSDAPQLTRMGPKKYRTAP
jgi:hypothetical protein